MNYDTAFDRLDYLILGGAVALLFAFIMLLLWLAYRHGRGTGERLASRGATRIILRTLTRGGDIQRWN
jgi:hypothetical protein